MSMSKSFVLPELGENIEAVDVSALLVKVGDQVRKDQPILEVETEKASLEIPAPFSGVITEVLINEGDKISIGQALFHYDAGSSAETPEPAPPAVVDPPAEIEPAPPVVEPAPLTPPAPPAPPVSKMVEAPPESLGDPVPAAPSVRRLAREIGVDLARVQGGGPGGRISREDVKLHAKSLLSGSGPAGPTALAELPDLARFGPVRRESLGNVRKATARNLARAWNTIPAVTQFDHADVTDLERLRKQWTGRASLDGQKLTVTAIILKVVASALKRFPRFNTALDLEHGELIYREYVHLGVAVDTDRGLLVPVLRDVDRKNIVKIVTELNDLAARARDRRLKPDEMQGAGFTISNLGGVGTTYFSPIVNWPEVAILGVGRSEMKPVWDGQAFQPRRILPLSLTYDHRVIDGADVARFLRWIAEALEEPLLMSLEG